MSDPDAGRAATPSGAPGLAPTVADHTPTSDALPDHAETADDAAETPSPAESGRPPASRRPPSHWLSFFVVTAVIVIADQISKRFIDRNLALGDSWPSETWPFRIMHVKNTGAAFSMLQNETVFLTVMSVVGLGAILLYFVYRPSDHPLLRYALGLQLGGAIGNLIDRARYGEVTDFFKIPHWPVFNVADSAISVGVTAVIVFLLFAGDGKPRHAEL